MSFPTYIEASRRLALLRLLVENGGGANESVLKTGLMALRFQGPTAGDTRADLLFLEERGLVKTDYYLDRVFLADITRRGLAYLARELPAIEGVEYPDMGR